MEFTSAKHKHEHFMSVEPLLHLCAIKMEERARAMKLDVDHDEMFQMCCETYAKCALAFDESRGFKFTTYLVNACYFNGNQWFKTQGKESSVVSRVSIDSYKFADGESMEEGIDAFMGETEESPEDRVIYAAQTAENIRRLSAAGKKLLGALANPPPELLVAFQGSDRSQFRDKRESDDIPAKFIADWLQISRNERRQIRHEINQFFGVDLQCFPK
jgi:hypothetical protein